VLVSARTALASSLVVLVALGIITIRNAFTYPAVGGYDAQEYISYAEGLVERGELPDSGVYHTPPGYPLLAGAAVELGRWLGMSEPEHLGQLVSALAVVLTGVVLLVLARVLWPARPLLWVAAVGFFAFLPIVSKAGAMFHPEPLGMLVTATALLLVAWIVRRRNYSWTVAIPLGLLLGVGQLVRGWSLWMVAVTVVVLGTLALTDPVARRRVLGFSAMVVVLAALVSAPWYAYQSMQHSNPVFNRPQPDTFILARRPLAFYVDARVPDVVTRPWSGRFNDRFWAVLYAETWGDYFGIWSWGLGRGERTDAIDATLTRQSVLGVLPTGLSLAGLVALLGLAIARPREDVGRLVAALPPVAAVASILYLAVAYPSTDGDTIKGTYALGAVPALALCFAFAVDVLARRRVVGVVLAIALAATAMAILPFVVW
jgi:hypothetical protein